MQHLAMVERFPNNRISPPVAHLNFLRSPHQQIQRESHRTETAHFPDLGQVAPSPRDNPARITIDPVVRFGKPCVRGTRLTVGDVLGSLASGMSEAELLQDFPQLCHDDVLTCLAYAADRERCLITLSSSAA